MKRRLAILRHPVRSYKTWKRTKELIVNSQINLYASRKHTLPLEQCGKLQLEAAIRHNEREAGRYEKYFARNPKKQNYQALARWHVMCQTPLHALMGMLEDDQRVKDIPWKQRRKPVEELMRIRSLD
jgi:hypothetical protein